MLAGAKSLDQPRLAAGDAAGPQRGHETRERDRRLPAAGRSENREEGRRLELLDQTLHVGIASEEELAVCLAERLEAEIRTHVIPWLDRSPRAERYPLDRVHERLERFGIVDSGAEVDPGACAEKRREPTRVEVLRKAGEEDEEQPEVAVLRRAIVCDGAFLALPVADACRADEHGAGGRRRQA